MHSQDEPQLTLSKWPFYLSDILLVAVALAIAILGKWQLSDMQVAYCVVSVALGAGLFVLPYIVEYYMRVKEVAEGHDDELRMLQRYLKQMESVQTAYDQRIAELESHEGSTANAEEMLATAMDQKLVGVEAVVSELRTALGTLELKMEEFAAAKPARDERDEASQVAIEALRQSMANLEARLPEVDEPLAKLEQRMQQLEAATAKLAVEKKSPRETRHRRTADAGLLKRAIKEKQDAASTAVSRIIESKAVSTEKKEEAAKTDVGQALPAQQASALLIAPDLSVADAAVVESDASKDAVVAASSARYEQVPQSDMATSPKAAEPAETKGTDNSEHEAQVSDQLPEQDLDLKVPPIEASDMLFDSVAETPVVKKARTKKQDAVLTVSVLIGIGNKPYLRGSGGGLSWEQGIVMDFQEIGKWRWVAPVDLSEPLELQVYRNDEDPDREGRHTLMPGQKLEISPKF